MVDGEPCVLCGASLATYWRDSTCSACLGDARTIDGRPMSRADFADRCAARLAGVRGAPDGIAKAIGFQFYVDTPKARPSEARWAYVNRDELTRRARACSDYLTA